MLLDIQDLNTFYDQSHVLQDTSLQIGQGEIVCLLGRNGVGKSTTLKSIIGLVTPRSGRIEFKGKNIFGLPPHTIAHFGIGYVPEERRIFPTLTLRENLLLGIKARQKKDEDGWNMEKIYQYFPILKTREKQKAGHLSGGGTADADHRPNAYGQSGTYFDR